MRRVLFLLASCFLFFSVSFSPHAFADASVPYPECGKAPHRNLCLVLERIREFSYTTFTAETLEAKMLSEAGLSKEVVPFASECAKTPYPKLCAFVAAKGRQRQEYFLAQILPRFIDHYYYWPPYAKSDFGLTQKILPWEDGKERVDVYDVPSEVQFVPSEYGVSRTINFKSSLKDGICLVSWSEFDMRVVPRFDLAIEKCQSGGNMRGIIIDLRGNPGGNLRSTLALASEFLPENSVLMYMQDKDTQALSPVQGWFSTKHHLAKTPLVILVDGNSASASEILAGSLQEYKRAVLISSEPRTFGKYTGQQVFSFDNGTWAVAFTVTEWYLPSKKSNKGGLTPDHVVPKELITQKAREVIAHFPYPLPVVVPAVAQ